MSGSEKVGIIGIISSAVVLAVIVIAILIGANNGSDNELERKQSVIEACANDDDVALCIIAGEAN